MLKVPNVSRLVCGNSINVEIIEKQTRTLSEARVVWTSTAINPVYNVSWLE